MPSLPLAGRRVVITRAKGQAAALCDRLRSLGAEPVELPTIEVRPAADPAPLDRALADLISYDWLIFTSANAVRFFAERARTVGVDLTALRARVCAIGPATRTALEAAGLHADLMAADSAAEGVVAAFARHPLDGRRVLLPRAAVARDLVPEELARRGARVDVVEAYRTVVPEGAEARARAVFASSHKPDFIAFTSSSTVRNLVALAGARALAGVRAVSIGPITSATARELGIEVAAEAREATTEGIIEAIRAICETEMTPPSGE
jgi:uroporphyrinogen-III synthase